MPVFLQCLIIVDIGTGSGKWVIEVAYEYSSTRVIGTDLSPIQDTEVPANAEFILMDLTAGLQFDDGSTDLVQSRFETNQQLY
jgi:ubiquinone/menaquinone biosynthesis C-methylase UbiE